MLEGVAGGGCAVQVIDVSRRLSARRPGDQHRHARGLRIMSELRAAVDRLGEPRIEAMNEQKNIAAAGRPERELSIERLKERLVAVEVLFVMHRKIDIRI